MLQTILDNRADAQTVFIVAMVLYAWRRGAGPEQVIAYTFAGMKVIQVIYFWISGGKASLLEVDMVFATVDLVGCIILVWVGLQANRMYTLWIGAFQIIALNAHIVREIADSISPIAYVIMFAGPFYFQLFILAGGIWFHARRHRRFGPYRSWRKSEPYLHPA